MTKQTLKTVSDESPVPGDGCVWSHHHTHLLRHSLAFLNENSPVSNFRNAYTSHFWLFGQRICWLLQEDCRVWKHKQLSSKSNSEPGLTLTCFAKGVWCTAQDSQQPDRQSVDLQFQLFSEETCTQTHHKVNHTSPLITNGKEIWGSWVRFIS